MKTQLENFAEESDLDCQRNKMESNLEQDGEKIKEQMGSQEKQVEDQVENIIGAADKEQQIEVPKPNQSSESVINRPLPKEKSLVVPTPFKGEVSLKRSAQEMSEEQRSSANKKSKLSGHEKEVISLADDEETSTNQVKGTLIEEETGQNVDAPQSDSERTLSQHQISKGVGKAITVDVDQ